jgi:hypothetical protein
MFLEKLIEAINDLFESFWLIVIILLPVILVVGWMIKQIEG